MPLCEQICGMKSFSFFNSLKFFDIVRKMGEKVLGTSDLKVIKEGLAEILVTDKSNVFYNPVQEFNRDLSVAVLKLLSKQKFENSNNEHRTIKPVDEIKVFEAFSASGLRSIRYAKEVDGLTEVIANDISINAIGNIQTNIKHNNVEEIVKISHSDAVVAMFNITQGRKRFQAVDLDPYGCPTPFLDTAVQCVADGGILMITATDMAVLCGNYPNTCYVKYGALSLKCSSCHEMAVRILLQCIESHANRHRRYIVPLLSVHVDFYTRVFVKVFTSAAMCQQSTSKLSHVYHCTGCESVTLQPLGLMKKNPDASNKPPKYSLPTGPPVSVKCQHCGGNHHTGGPIWSAPMYDETFLGQLLTLIETENFATQKRLLGVLSVIREELVDVPLYYKIDKLCTFVKLSPPPQKLIRSAILNGGYRVSLSHACKGSLKTDAPMDFVWDILREWAKLEYPDKELPKDPETGILGKPIKNQINFSLRRDAIPSSIENKLLRFQVNPTSHWGPGAKGAINDKVIEKKERNQNKRKKRMKEDRDVKIAKTGMNNA